MFLDETLHPAASKLLVFPEPGEGGLRVLETRCIDKFNHRLVSGLEVEALQANGLPGSGADGDGVILGKGRHNGGFSLVGMANDGKYGNRFHIPEFSNIT